MKKPFRLIIIIVLLFGGVGFVYLVQNPDLPISQKILKTFGVETAITPIISTGTITGIDLTNCVSYFDGCNNCSVRDGKVEACTLMYCEMPGTPKCNQYTTDKNSGSADMANPASVNCERNGGTLSIVSSSDGSQVGMCALADGSTCEERAYMRGECGTQNPGNPGYSPGDEGTMCTMEYAPVCALIQIQCIKAPCEPVEQTFGNRCMMNANKLAIFLHEGECGSPSTTTKTSCPQRAQPGPDFCSKGTIVAGGKDPNGCQLPPRCQMK